MENMCYGYLYKRDTKPRLTTRNSSHTAIIPVGAQGSAREEKKIFEAWNEYYCVPLRNEHRHLTSFIIPCDRYWYRTVEGYIISSVTYIQRYDKIVSHFPNKTKCVDDCRMTVEFAKLGIPEDNPGLH